MNAERIATALGGRKVGGGWMARCPAHDDREPSLSIRDGDAGTVLVHCHAGCHQEDVIATLQPLGLWWQRPREHRHIYRRASRPDDEQQQRDQDDLARTEVALGIWAATKTARGTHVESYLRSRGLWLPIPETIRFHAGLKHPSGGAWPGMVALVTSGGHDVPLAIHRTFLAFNGSHKAPISPQKMMLGPCRGGAVRLAACGAVLMVGEGIETCLAAMQASTHPAWAALSTSGLRVLVLPDEVCDVIVLADGDEPGETAARDCASRWKREGRRVRIARPPQGMDFNDLLIGRAPRRDEDAL